LDDHASENTSYSKDYIDNTRTPLVGHSLRDGFESRIRTRFLAIWPLVTHFILTNLVAAVMLTYVNNHYFSITTRTPDVRQADGSVTHWQYTLLQTDVTTALSFAQTVMRFVGALWTVPTVWRCIYILLELESVSLAEINWMLTWSLPTARMGGQIMVAIILLAAFPAQFSSPILTGSITWRSSRLLTNGTMSVGGISVSTDGPAFAQYWLIPPNAVDTIIPRAVAIADIAWGGRANTSSTPLPKRVLTSAQHVPLGSTLKNATTPYLIIDALDWIRDPKVSHALFQDGHGRWFPQDFPLAQIFTPFSNWTDNPFVALVPDHNWWGIVTHQWPQPTIVSETRTMMLVADRILNATSTTTCSRNSGYLGYIPPEIILEADFQQGREPMPSFTICFAYANVTYRAGVVTCNNCNISAPMVLEMASDAVVPKLQPDVMTEDALRLAPKVAQSMLLGNFSAPNVWNDTDIFVREMLVRSYQAAWNALTDRFQAPSTSVESRVEVPIQLSQALVAPWRIYLWVGLNFMLTLSGILFWIAQKRCKKPMVIDAGVAALLVNPVGVLDIAKRELNDLSILLDADSKAVGPMKLVLSDRHRILIATDHR
jgi:hypothetical protein